MNDLITTFFDNAFYNHIITIITIIIVFTSFSIGLYYSIFCYNEECDDFYYDKIKPYDFKHKLNILNLPLFKKLKCNKRAFINFLLMPLFVLKFISPIIISILLAITSFFVLSFPFHLFLHFLRDNLFILNVALISTFILPIFILIAKGMEMYALEED